MKGFLDSFMFTVLRMEMYKYMKGFLASLMLIFFLIVEVYEYMYVDLNGVCGCAMYVLISEWCL